MTGMVFTLLFRPGYIRLSFASISILFDDEASQKRIFIFLLTHARRTPTPPLSLHSRSQNAAGRQKGQKYYDYIFIVIFRLHYSGRPIFL